MARGISFRRLFWILFLGLAVYTGIKVVPPWAGYLLLKYEVASETKSAHLYTDDEIVGHIISAAGTWGVILGEDDITLERDDVNVEIMVNYSVTIHFLGRHSKTFWYEVYEHRRLRTTEY